MYHAMQIQQLDERTGILEGRWLLYLTHGQVKIRFRN